MCKSGHACMCRRQVRIAVVEGQVSMTARRRQRFVFGQVWLAKTEEQVRMAERALLYQLGFVFHAALPYTPLDTMIEHARRYSEQVFPNRKEVVQTAWNFLNDRCAMSVQHAGWPNPFPLSRSTLVCTFTRHVFE